MFSKISKIFSHHSGSVAEEERAHQSNLNNSNANESVVGLQPKEPTTNSFRQRIAKTISNDLKIANKPASSYERSLEEFTQSDHDRRNILHRAALEQNPKLIEDILDEYKTIVPSYPQDRFMESMKEYVGLKDKFHTTPMLMSCYLNNSTFKQNDTNPRLECLTILQKWGADVNGCNPRTFWSPIHWAAYYDDLPSAQFLIQLDCHLFKPDKHGFYPLDLAGRNNHGQVAIVIIEYLVKLMIDYERWKYESKRCTSERRQDLIETLMEQQDRFMQNPMLKTSTMYWICNFRLKVTLLESVWRLRNAYLVSPMYLVNEMSPLHISIKRVYIPGIQFIVEKLNQPREDYMHTINDRHEHVHIPQTYQSNHIYSFTIGELNIYASLYRHNVLNFSRWEELFLLNHLQLARKEPAQGGFNLFDALNLPAASSTVQRGKYENYLNQQEAYGNTPLHLAAIENNPEIIDLFLKEGASQDIENKEFWHPKDLATSKQALECFDRNSNQKSTEIFLIQIHRFLETSNLRVVAPSNNSKNLKEPILLKDFIKNMKKDDLTPNLTELHKLSQTLIVPDYVIKCKLSTKNFLEDPNLNRLNFQISLLQNAKFHIYLAQSALDPKYYYIMLQHTLEQLELQAIIGKMELKLIDSYDNEPFDLANKSQFEPFRSRQRQDIIQQHLTRIINMEEQQDAGVVDSFYRMHSFGGMSTIKDKWIEKPKWYWPQPLNQLDDYLLEGKNQNFTSCTVLRLYFGEKISFFFAWKSYFTCVLIAVAVPGLALQVYILYTGDFNNAILPFWVIYVQLWSTVSVEFWKRKTCEINARWGLLDLMNDESAQEQELREGFSGDEEIDLVRGELTKHEKRIFTILVFLISVPVLILLTSLVIIIFLAIDQYNQSIEGSSFVKTAVVGIMQGGSITILNITYTAMAQWFAQKENHKFKAVYESSLIYKNVFFKFINSYLAVFYTAFIKQNYGLGDIFFLMMPVLIVKQFNYILLSVVIPQIVYKHKESQYFKQLELNMRGAVEYNNRKATHDSTPYSDQIERLWTKTTNKTLPSQPRAILHIVPETVDYMSNPHSTKSKQPPAPPPPKKPTVRLASNIDIDAVELNGLKFEANNNLIIDYFMESVIDFGYISLFSAAFPIGPAIAMLMNIVEIRMKIITYLFVYKKPSAERAPGIGDWLYIWEYMSFIGVFTNFTLLYLKSSTQLHDYYFDKDSIIKQESMLWVFLFLMFLIIMVKYLIQKLIPDKPRWVIEEEEERKAQRKQQSMKEDLLQEMEQKNEALQIQVREMEEAIQRMKRTQRTVVVQQPVDVQGIQVGTIAEEKQTSAISRLAPLTPIDEKIKRVYFALDRELVAQRLAQVRSLMISNRQTFVQCSECLKEMASYMCQQCNMQFCINCYDRYHDFSQLHNHGQYKSLIITDFKAPSQGAVNYKATAWRKFQYFALPTQPDGHFHRQLQQSFDLLYGYYNRANITFSKQIFIGNISGQFLADDDFNVEDKLFLNRLFFLTIRKQKTSEIKYSDFLRHCNILQDGLLEQKLVQLVEFLDENDTHNIPRVDFNRFCILSFLQDVTQQMQIETIAEMIFEKKKNIAKKELTTKLLLTIEQNPQAKDYLKCLLQC